MPMVEAQHAGSIGWDKEMLLLWKMVKRRVIILYWKLFVSYICGLLTFDIFDMQLKINTVCSNTNASIQTVRYLRQIMSSNTTHTHTHRKQTWFFLL